MEDGLADDDDTSTGGNWHVSRENLKQIEKAITWPTLSKIAAALRRSLPDRRSHFDDDAPSTE
jgi:hypothetical protein